MKLNNFLKFIITIVISELAGVIGSIFTTPAIPNWYAGLSKPTFTPPAWIFAPVWTTLFLLMGIAAFLIWRKGFERREVKIALGVFIAQLVLNTLWSIIFFGLQNPGAAFAEIIILWLAIVAVIILFAKISKGAAWLLVPYILWVSFAGFLNFSIWQMPAVVEIEPSWKSITDSQQDLSFKYPEVFPAEYITPLNWPPEVVVQNNSDFTCPETPGTSSTSERVTKRTVSGQTYCVYASSEDTAGSIYTDYSYHALKNNKLLVINFVLQYPQCLNYDNPQQTTCQNERTTFNLDDLVNRIFQTLVFK